MRYEVQALEQFFAAINRNDMQAITKDFAPDIVRIEPDGFPTAGTYRGVDECARTSPQGAVSGPKAPARPKSSSSTATRSSPT